MLLLLLTLLLGPIMSPALAAPLVGSEAVSRSSPEPDVGDVKTSKSAASAEVARWMAEPGPWVIEGAATARALRKALAASPAAPCDLLIVLTVPKVERSPGQVAMGKGVHTVLDGIRAELLARGVTIEEGEAPALPAPEVAQMGDV